MLSSHSWWKWSEPTMTSTSGSARVSVSRNAWTLRTHSSANGGPVLAGGGAGLVVERMVGGGDDRDELGHGGSSRGVGGQSASTARTGVAVDVQVDVHAERAAALLGELAEQAGRPGQQGEAAQQLDRQAEVGERGAADAGAVERQGPAEHLRVDPADRLEQPQVRAAQALLARRSRSAPGVRGSCSLCTGWPSPGTQSLAARARGPRRSASGVPAGVVGRRLGRDRRGCRRGTGRSPR